MFLGNFSRFRECFWGGRRGAVPAFSNRGGMAEINIYLQKLGNWFFIQIYFLIFFIIMKIDFLKILISQYFVFFLFQHFYIFSNCTSV